MEDCDQQPIIHGKETMVVEIMSLGEIDHDPCYSMMTTSVISILHSPNVHTLHCQPRASRSETMENETHNPHIFTVTIINNTQFRQRNMRGESRNTDEDYDGMPS